MKSRLMPMTIPTRRTVLAVRCVLALVALVSSLANKNTIMPVLYGIFIWRWKEEWKQPVESQNEVERAQFYHTELKKWRGLMVINAVISLVCFSIILARGDSFQVALSHLSVLIAVIYWFFDRTRALVLLTSFVAFAALIVIAFGPFEISFR